MFWLGLDHQISGGQGPHLARCVIGPHQCTCQMASTSVQRFRHKCDRQTTLQRNVEEWAESLALQDMIKRKNLLTTKKTLYKQQFKLPSRMSSSKLPSSTR